MRSIIHVLYVSDEHGWYAQCLEYDLGAQGSSFQEAEAAFFRTWHLQAVMDRDHGRTPFDGLGEAPQSYWRMFEEAGDMRGNRTPAESDFPPAFMIAAQLDRHGRESVVPRRRHS